MGTPINLAQFGSDARALLLEFVSDVGGKRLKRLLPKAYGGTHANRRKRKAG